MELNIEDALSQSLSEDNGNPSNILASENSDILPKDNTLEGSPNIEEVFHLPERLLTTQKIYIFVVPCDVDEKDAIKVEKSIISQSLTLKNMIEDLGGDEIPPIPLASVKLIEFKKIIEYLEYRAEHPYVPPTKIPKSSPYKKGAMRDLDEWENEYCPKEYKDLFELILSVNFLDIRELMNILCKKVSKKIEGLTTEEIRTVFNIKNDFTPEEEEKIIKENDWVEK